MPTLLVHHAGQSRGVVLTGRLLIGRVAPGGVVIPDPSVSRIHAWIDTVEDRFYIADAMSRGGTVVGEHPIASRHVLQDGDQIRIGPATITYQDTEELPADVEHLPVTHANGVAVAAAGGVLFACKCGAPLWAPANWEGRQGRCEHCRERTTIPALPSPARSRPDQPPTPAAAESPAVARICSICQWAIEDADAHTTCPTCHLTFHSDCWQENRGCSAYGCASVNALATPEERAADDEPAPESVTADVAASESEEAEANERFPVEFALLGGSVVSLLLGLLTFGVPAALLAVGANLYWITQRRRGESVRNAVVASAVAISVAGIMAGLWISAFRWLHRPFAAPWQHG